MRRAVLAARAALAPPGLARFSSVGGPHATPPPPPSPPARGPSTAFAAGGVDKAMHDARARGAGAVVSALANGLLLPAAAAAAAAAYFLSGRDDATLSALAFAAGGAAMPVMRMLDAETAHRVAVAATALGLAPREYRPDPASLRTSVFGLDFPNPLGMAAGFDKDGTAAQGLLDMGFGFVEVGSVTPLPQEGNPKPRVFRLPEHKAVVNRYGFNSAGAAAVAATLVARESVTQSLTQSRTESVTQSPPDSPPAPRPRGVVGINLGKNKTTADAAADYESGISALGGLASYLVVNVSSPNTPGLRALQGRSALRALLGRARAARDALPQNCRPPLLVKIAPDLTAAELADVAAVVRDPACGVAGVIVSNTTVGRPPEVTDSANAAESGGLSGPPLRALALSTLREVYRLTGGAVPLIGCGGVASGADAYERIRAGASLVQLYTAFSYDGPPLLPSAKAQLAACLERDGFACVADAVGADVKAKQKKK